MDNAGWRTLYSAAFARGRHGLFAPQINSQYDTAGSGSVSGQGTGRFAARFAEWVVAHPWRVILASLFLVAAAASGILRLGFSGDYRIFFDEDNPQLLALEALEDTYGKNENVVFLIVPGDGDATSQTALSAAAWLTEEAWQTPWSRRVDSLTNFQHTTADGDDLYVRNLVDPQQLADPQARSRIRAVALADPRVEGSILATGGDVSVVNVTVELPEGDLLEAVAEVAGFARGIAAQAEEQFAGIDIRVVGTVMVNQTFLEASVDSQMIFLPTSLAIMAVILGILIRGWAGVAATGIVIVFSIIASIGLGGWAGLPFSPPIAPAPTIVLMIVGGELRSPAGDSAAADARRRFQAGSHHRIREDDPTPGVPGEPYHGVGIPEHEFFRGAAVPSPRQLRRIRDRHVIPSFRYLSAGHAFAAPGSGRIGSKAHRSPDALHGRFCAAPQKGAAVGMGSGNRSDDPGDTAQRTQRRAGPLLRRKR